MIGYMSPDLAVTRETFVVNAGGAATTEYGKFRSFNKLKLLRAKAWVSTAGTNVAHKYDIYVGTTSVGVVTPGTGAADTSYAVTLNTSVPAETPVFAKSGADIVGKANITFEYKRDD